ncbi:MAG TPA: 50S ribosomal protein L29 [Chloroflexota bacterium]|nr:50S ribosomal protein L29 [Chloroflexota bacterium]
MKPREIRDLAQGELERRLEEAYEELRNLRFQHATRQLQNTARFRSVRQDIARMKTVLRERELAGAANG